MKFQIITFLSVLFISSIADACSVCFYGDGDDPATRSLTIGMLVLIGALVIVGVPLVLFFRNFTKRSKLINN